MYSHNNICNIQMKIFKTCIWNNWNTLSICLKHAYIVIVTYKTSQIYIYNIQIKHLKHKSKTPETLETRRCRQPWPTWWGTTVASELGFKGTSRATGSNLLVVLGWWWWRFARHDRDERGGWVVTVDASRARDGVRHSMAVRQSRRADGQR
jgi:hypothetical protein